MFKLTERDTANLIAIAKVESGFNPDAAAKPLHRADGKETSAAGVFQVTDTTARDMARHSGTAKLNNMVLGEYNRFDADSNIRYGIATYIMKKRMVGNSDDVGEIYIKWNSNPNEYNRYLSSLRQDASTYLDKIDAGLPITATGSTVGYGTDSSNFELPSVFDAAGDISEQQQGWGNADGSTTIWKDGFKRDGTFNYTESIHISAAGTVNTDALTTVGDDGRLQITLSGSQINFRQDNAKISLLPNSMGTIYGEGLNVFGAVGDDIRLVGNNLDVTGVAGSKISVGGNGIDGQSSYDVVRANGADVFILDNSRVDIFNGSGSSTVNMGLNSYIGAYGGNMTVNGNNTGAIWVGGTYSTDATKVFATGATVTVVDNANNVNIYGSGGTVLGGVS